MRFRTIQENLRKVLWERIRAKQLTGLGLAEMTGFKQAHISNFLNGKRGLSPEGMDRVLQVQKLSVLDLLDADEVNKRASITPPSDDQFENVLLVDATIAANEPLVTSEKVKDILKYKKNFLKRLRPNRQDGSARDEWRRFVLIKVEQKDGMSMYPRLLPNATVLIDRHYTSLQPYRKNEPNMYAVRKNGGCTVKYVEMSGNNLVLRPHNQGYPVELLPIAEGKSYADYIVGRICHVEIEA
jgi:transcriptional regulator with XRE-family HTH domain